MCVCVCVCVKECVSLCLRVYLDVYLPGSVSTRLFGILQGASSYVDIAVDDRCGVDQNDKSSNFVCIKPGYLNVRTGKW